jgi:transposase-like protein
MQIAVGSPASVRCPKCPARTAKIALSTAVAIYYRCNRCHHVWAVLRAKSAAAGRRKAS